MWLSNCTASLCKGWGFVVFSTGANADMTLINCRAFGNLGGIYAQALSFSGSATARIANCAVTQNGTGIITFNGVGFGPASVLGTSPGSNIISRNGSGNATTGSVTSQ